MESRIALSKIQEARRPVPPPGLWQAFSAAPHRMFFAGGLVFLLLDLLWWSAELLGRYSGLWPSLPVALPAAWAHAFLMVYGVFPFFVFGFLFTVYPRWMRTPVVPRRLYVAAFLLLAGGMLAVYLGLWTHRWLVLAGMALFLAGWSVALYALLRSYLAAEVERTDYENIFNFNLLAGWAGVLWYFAGLLGGHWLWLHYAVQLGLWVFLVPLLVGVCHRMIPYFSSAVLKNYVIYRPFWIVPAILAGGVVHAWFSAQTEWAWRLAGDLPLMGLAFYLSYRWEFRRSFQDRLLAVLHLAFLWLGIALLLFNLQSAWLLAGGQMILGKAPLHALSIGFMLSLVVAMASRVMMGHSGRLLLADNLTWYAFWGVGAAALLRMAAEIPGLEALNLGAAFLAVTVAAVWVWRYLPILWQPRVDGEAG